MTLRTLLVINCALDESYTNRTLLYDLYRDRFREIAFTISPTCQPDPAFRNITQTWIPPSDDAACLCGNAALGEHAAIIHSFHPRLIDVAAECSDVDYVLFTEDDCLLSPRLGESRLARWNDEFDCVAPPIFYCSPTQTEWMWTRHDSVFPKFSEVASHFSGKRLATNWVRYHGAVPLEQPELPLFCGFVDWLAMRANFLRDLADDLIHLRRVWHEVAIPTAILHGTSRVGISNGRALWGEERQQSLDALMTMLATHDFVHPVKLFGIAPDKVVTAYRRAIR